MSLRNQHIGLAIAVAIAVVGGFATSWEPSDGEVQAMTIAMFLSAVGLSIFLDERDARRGRRPRGRVRR